jgi:hypothetical protein
VSAIELFSLVIVMKTTTLGLSIALLGLSARCAARELHQQPLGQPLAGTVDSIEHAFPTSESAGKTKPNIIFILVDDQDVQLGSLSYMPLLDKHLGKKGTFYKNHFAPTAICCPARVSIWTGRYAHNTNVTDVNPPYGKSSFSSSRFLFYFFRKSPFNQCSIYCP